MVLPNNMSCSKETWVKEETPGCERIYKIKQHRRTSSVHQLENWVHYNKVKVQQNKQRFTNLFENYNEKEQQQQHQRPLGKRCCTNNSDSSDSDYNCNDHYPDPQLRLVEWYEVDYVGVKLFKEFEKEERDGALLQPDDNQLLAEIDLMVKYIWLVQRRWFNIELAQDIVLAGSNKYSDREIGTLLQNLVSRAQNSLQRNGYSKVAEQLGRTWYKYYNDGRVSRAVMYNRFVDGVGAFVKFEEDPFTDNNTKAFSVIAKKFLQLCSRTYTKYHKRHFDRRQAIRSNLKKMLTPEYE